MGPYYKKLRNVTILAVHVKKEHDGEKRDAIMAKVMSVDSYFNGFDKVPKFTAYSICNPVDNWDEKYGVYLAVKRCYNSFYSWAEKKTMNRAINDFHSDFKKYD